MMNLYRNKPILFAVLWIVFYVVTAGTLRSGGDDSPYMTIGLIVIAGVLLLFIHKNGLAQELGLTSWPNNTKQMLYFVPVWIITTGNLWTGVDPHYQGLNLVCAIVSMALVGVVEELIFRGLLFRGMLKEGSATSAIVVSALTFGIGHIVNLLNGQDTLETLVQIVFAVAIGLMFTLVYYKGGSNNRVDNEEYYKISRRKNAAAIELVNEFLDMNETVVIQEAYDEVITDSPAWEEHILRCSICGATK